MAAAIWQIAGAPDRYAKLKTAIKLSGQIIDSVEQVDLPPSAKPIYCRRDLKNRPPKCSTRDTDRRQGYC